MQNPERTDFKFTCPQCGGPKSRRSELCKECFRPKGVVPRCIDCGKRISAGASLCVACFKKTGRYAAKKYVTASNDGGKTFSSWRLTLIKAMHKIIQRRKELVDLGPLNPLFDENRPARMDVYRQQNNMLYRNAVKADLPINVRRKNDDADSVLSCHQEDKSG